MNIWDSVDDHHKYQHSPDFIPFLEACYPMVGAEITIRHFAIDSHPEGLKAAIESPCTHVSVVPISMMKTSQYIKWWEEEAPKHFETIATKVRGIWAQYPKEDP